MEKNFDRDKFYSHAQMLSFIGRGRWHRLMCSVYFCCFSVFLLGYPMKARASESAAVLPEEAAPSQGYGLAIDPKTKKISVDYKDANLVSVLKALSYSLDFNLVMAKDVQGTVSASLKEITLDEMLTAILSVTGYRYIRKNNIIYVMKAGDVETAVQPYHLSFLKAADAKQMLSKTISSAGDIQINETTNSLVVVDILENIEKVNNVLAEIDQAPIQVLIEAKIVDIQKRDFENLGTTIEATYDPKGDLGGGLWNRKSLADENVSLSTDLTGTSTEIPGSQVRLTPTFKSLSMDVNIDALIQKNRANVLASPSIATLNGKEAKIIIGERFPFLETTQTASGNTQTTRFVDVGTSLRVTPMVSPDGWITMQVHPEVSSVAASLTAGPRITTREADSTIRVRDGETIVIGGLINQIEDRTNAGVPILRAIPIIGGLFSKRSSDREDTELTVFITPRIIRASSVEGDDWRSYARGYQPDYAQKGDQYMLNSMLAYIQRLEPDESKRHPEEDDLYRYSEILQTYKSIYNQFPDAPEADLCLYKIAKIYSDVFNKATEATISLSELIRKFPDSVYRQDAEKMLQSHKKNKAQ